MTSVSNNLTVDRDIRSEARSYKRAKDHSAKWACGARPLAGPRLNFWEEWQYTEGEKIRPEKRYCDRNTYSTKARVDELYYHDLAWQGAASGRVQRKNDTARELAYDGQTLSKSILDLVPTSDQKANAKTQVVPPDSGITYSFDAATSPQKKVGLDSLVEKAEQEWITRETDKVVRNEYEVLDGSGDKVVLAAGKKGKKGSPKQKPTLVVDAEDDWEKV